MIIILSILYLLVGLFCCGVLYQYHEREKLERDSICYPMMLLLWPVWFAFALGVAAIGAVLE